MRSQNPLLSAAPDETLSVIDGLWRDHHERIQRNGARSNRVHDDGIQVYFPDARFCPQQGADSLDDVGDSRNIERGRATESV